MLFIYVSSKKGKNGDNDASTVWTFFIMFSGWEWTRNELADCRVHGLWNNIKNCKICFERWHTCCWNEIFVCRRHLQVLKDVVWNSELNLEWCNSMHHVASFLFECNSNRFFVLFKRKKLTWRCCSVQRFLIKLKKRP